MWLRVAFQYSILLYNDKSVETHVHRRTHKGERKNYRREEKGPKDTKERQLKINKNAT